jgi:TatD DNase family protein
MKYFDIHSHNGNQSILVTSIQNVIPGQAVPESPFSAGFHPWYASDFGIADLKKLAENKNCVAIGECGLDSLKLNVSLPEQEKQFRVQLALAQKMNLPVILHVVRSEQLLESIFSDFRNLRYIWHGFTGNIATVKRFLKFDMYFSFGQRGINKPDVWPGIPQDRLFCETDDASVSIEVIYTALSKILKIELEQLAAIIANNTQKVFGNGLER